MEKIPKQKWFICRICKKLTDKSNESNITGVCEYCKKYDEPAERGSTLP